MKLQSDERYIEIREASICCGCGYFMHYDRFES